MAEFNQLNIPGIHNQLQSAGVNQFNYDRAQVGAEREDKAYDYAKDLENTRLLFGGSKVMLDYAEAGDMDSYAAAYLELAPVYVERGALDPNKFDINQIPPVDVVMDINARAKAGLAGRATNSQIGTGTKTDRVPAKIQQAQWWMGADPQSRAGYMQANYAGNVKDIGGVPHWVFPGGDSMPLTTLENEAGGQANIAGAVQGAKEDATTAAVGPRGEEDRLVKLRNTAPAAHKSVNYAVTQVDRFTEQAIRLRNHPGLSKATGFGGEQLSGVPGTDAADAAALMNTLKSQAFISALGAMREASKTGGAVGNVSDAEGGRFENAFVALTQAQSYPQFVEELDRLISMNAESKNLLIDAYSSEYGQIEGAPRLQSSGGGSSGSQQEIKATNPQTGEKIIFRNGRWEPYQ